MTLWRLSIQSSIISHAYRYSMSFAVDSTNATIDVEGLYRFSEHCSHRTASNSKLTTNVGLTTDLCTFLCNGSLWKKLFTTIGATMIRPRDWIGQASPASYTHGKAAQRSTKDHVAWLHLRPCLVPSSCRAVFPNLFKTWTIFGPVYIFGDSRWTKTTRITQTLVLENLVYRPHSQISMRIKFQWEWESCLWVCVTSLSKQGSVVVNATGVTREGKGGTILRAQNHY